MRNDLYKLIATIALLATIAAFPQLATANSEDGPSVVRVERADDGSWTLLRNGEPYFIRGAGGGSHLDLLKKAGGNSIRRWHVSESNEELDRAHERGLTVCQGIWLGHERHGFNYDDKTAVEEQRRMVERIVRAHKDHPALLMWGVGNEVALTGDPNRFFPELENVAKLIKSIDPNHPTIVVIAGADKHKVRAFMEHCPSVDILGVNKYGGAEHIAEWLAEAGYDGPYAVTEYGPQGHWEIGKAPWGAPLEPTSAEKVAMYRRSYEGAIEANRDQCIGSYVFLWGHKQETTATWFGLFLKDGGRTAVVDEMQRLWTGSYPENRAPTVSEITSPVALKKVAPNSEFEATLVTNDPDDDQLTTEWLIVAETRDRKMGGDAEAAPPSFPDLTLESTTTSAVLRSPGEPGPYRLFVTVRDSHGGAGTANIPFFVETPGE
ncbi:MAG: hypothetical protein CMJ31_05235 [Phycisphaerae bacterium]|nr:hypothetical protein [Phycisphaerae bacterium]